MHVTESLRDQVKTILAEQPASRDDDQVLMFFWLQYYSAFAPSQLTVQHYLKLQRHGKVPKMQALTRTRRWAQQHDEDLRGAEYDARTEHQDTVKAELGYHNQFHPNTDSIT